MSIVCCGVYFQFRYFIFSSTPRISRDRVAHLGIRCSAALSA